MVQRHALILDDPGSDISLNLQSIVAVRGLSMGPSKTLVGKHSLKTAKKERLIYLPTNSSKVLPLNEKPYLFLIYLNILLHVSVGDFFQA